MSAHPSFQLSNGLNIPSIGLGTWRMPSEDVRLSIEHAFNNGYRLIDTAMIYRNERAIGQAIRDLSLPREELFITTKVWNSDQGYEETLRAFDTSLNELQMEYVDLYLVHWPKGQLSVDTWRALETLYEQGRTKSIGVCNFMSSQLTEFLPTCHIKPMVNQFEHHPYLQQTELVDLCNQNNILIEAWAPVMQGRANDVPLLAELAEKYGKTASQICLRWIHQRGLIIIPKSVRPERIAENQGVLDFELSSEDMERIKTLDRSERFGPDPLNFDF